MRYGLRLLAIVLLVASMSFASVQAKNLNDFTITKYDTDVMVGRDAEKRSTLKVTETITAVFSEQDINKGLERAIPKKYDGHTTRVEVVSVTDETGKNREYKTENNDGMLLVLMTDGSYVHGEQTYKITYTQRDVTHVPDDADIDEWYWDILGAQWKVPIEKFSWRVAFDNDLYPAMSGASACYYGKKGSTERCMMASDRSTTPQYFGTVENLAPGQAVTVAFGFKKDTFVGYQFTLMDKVVQMMEQGFAAAMAILTGLSVWMAAVMRKLKLRKKEWGPVPTEYIPLRDVSVTTASDLLLRQSNATATAQLIDLAVRHYIVLHEVKQKSLWSAGQYEIEVKKPLTDLKWEEREILEDIFGTKNVTPGMRYNLKKLRNNTSYARRLQNNQKDMQKKMQAEYGLLEKNPEKLRMLGWLMWVAIVGAVLTVSPLLLFFAVALFFVKRNAHVVTQRGMEVARYMEGFKRYVTLAEKDRLAALQSPEGAQKVADSEFGTSKVELYERVLPYAMLFGAEKEWVKQLGDLYEESGNRPDWYTGNTATFSAASFASGMDGLAAAGSYAGSTSSSSSGSSGGGSAGGGGGGGGGGGI